MSTYKNFAYIYNGLHGKLHINNLMIMLQRTLSKPTKQTNLFPSLAIWILNVERDSDGIKIDAITNKAKEIKQILVYSIIINAITNKSNFKSESKEITSYKKDKNKER